MKNKFFKLVLCLMLVAGLASIFPRPLSAQSETIDPVIKAAQVAEVIEQGEDEVAGEEAPYQILKITFKQEDDSPTELQIKHGGVPTVNFNDYQPGDRIYIRFSDDPAQFQNQEVLKLSQAQVIGYARQQTIVIMLLIFIAAVVVVNGIKGIRSIISLILSFLVIFLVVLPLILQNLDPVLVASLLSILIIPITFYFSHGWKRKTHIAVLATIIALIFSSLLAVTFINTSHLTGFSSEEAGFLSLEQEQINVRGLLLAGIIIGLLGTLDDITVTQAGVVFSLKENNQKLDFKQLYQQSMEIGKDHITSMVNTLVLVYTGAALPLLLLFVNNPHPLGYVLSQEIVVEEIVRTLVSSIGLIAAAPLTSLVAAAAADWKQISKRLQVK